MEDRKYLFSSDSTNFSFNLLALNLTTLSLNNTCNLYRDVKMGQTRRTGPPARQFSWPKRASLPTHFFL